MLPHAVTVKLTDERVDPDGGFYYAKAWCASCGKRVCRNCHKHVKPSKLERTGVCVPCRRDLLGAEVHMV